MRKLFCQIITPEKIVYADEVDMVVATGVDGEFGILPLHTPFIALLKIGELRVKKGEEQEYIAVHGGYLEVLEDRVTVLSEAAELASQIDVERAKRAKEEAEKKLQEEGAAAEDLKKAQQSLEKALLRLKISSRRPR
jgi:F-type H+-transporting ATPase subunit epsilon